MLLPLSAELQQPNFDQSQLEIGINWTLGSVPLSHWDQSQCPIGISPNWTLGSVPMSDWDQSQFEIGINPLQFHLSPNIPTIPFYPSIIIFIRVNIT